MTRALLLLAGLSLSCCIFDAELKHDTGSVPAELADGWAVASPKSVDLSSTKLGHIHEQLLREDRYRGSLSLLVIKHGKLVFETYLRRAEDRDHYQHVQSVTKSITSLLVGIASDQGKLGSLDQNIGELFGKDAEGLSAKKRAITLRQLLTMSSGLSFDNDEFSVEMWVDKPSDPIRYMLEKPLYAAPGKEFYYRDVDPQLVGYVLQKKVGESEQQYANATLLAALDIRDYYWDAGPDGVSMAAHGLHLLPRDLAKLGQLVLQQGVWNGKQVVSSEWLEQSTSAQIESDVSLGGTPLSYGYYWWLIPNVGYAMWGHGGQFVLVVPSQDMVLVQTAFPDTDLPDSTLQDFLQLVNPLLSSE